MGHQNNEEQQPDKLQDIIALAIEDEKFRIMLKDNIRNAVDSYQEMLKFKSSSLSELTIQTIKHISLSEILVLKEIFEKGKRGGIKSRNMF